MRILSYALELEDGTVRTDPSRYFPPIDTWTQYEGLLIANPEFVHTVLYVGLSTIAVLGTWLYRLGRHHGRKEAQSSSSPS